MSGKLDPLLQLIPQCMLADRHRLQKRLRDLQNKGLSSSSYPEKFSLLEKQVMNSVALAEQRHAVLPRPEFPAELPITARLDDIQEIIRDNQVVVLCGETGSGKSTQLPKICLSLGRGIFGRIGHTQPRRIAARSLASRVAFELGQQVGESVGYKVRFSDKIGRNTHIKLMTDGILLAEIQQDHYLNEYDTIIIDEAHERSLNIDFLLGYLKNLLPKRPDLKIIVTSATIDPECFSKHFHDAPVMEVSGRTYPVDVRYRPPDDETGAERDMPVQQALLDAVDELSSIDRGDILIFLSGEREIRETAESLRKHKLQMTEVLPLYARLGPAEQSRIFKPSGLRRIILATNVAETSLTVPGIRYVIDTGFARISRYSYRSKIQRLPIERISQASADQRKGRCGRVSEGICIRLFSEDDFLSRAEYTEPEIQRTNLASVILQMKLLGFGSIERFPFIDPPDTRLIKDGYRVLHELGATDNLQQVTQLGRKLSKLPIDPRIGRMLLEAAHTHCLREVLIIAAALSVQDPRDRPMDKQQAADEAHALFKNEESDFVVYLNIWSFLEEKRRHLTQRKFRRLCRDHFLSYTRVQEWHDIHQQLRVQMHGMGYRDNQMEPGYELIHKALLSGLLSHIGFRPSGKNKEYQGPRNSNFLIFPGSGVFAKPPKWIMAAELVETTRLYARNVASIRPDWIESLAGHLVKRSYSEPHWQSGRGQVGAFETVSLFGVVLVARRRVNYGPINPTESREIFIRFALTEGDFHTRAPFWRHNQELIAHVHDMEAKSRRRDVLVEEESIYRFYDQQIPSGIYSKPQFDQWLRKAASTQPKLLHMRLEDIMQRTADEVTEEQFPDFLLVGGLQLPLTYHFEPGHEKDGVTVSIPAAVLKQVTEGRLDWLVPGLLKEKLIALLKGLPKSLRRQFVPVPDFAERCWSMLTPSERPLVQELGAALKQISGHHIPEDEWQIGNLPAHLRMRIEVLDGSGNVIADSRDLTSLQRKYAGTGADVPLGFAQTGHEQTGLTDWTFGDLPASIKIGSHGIPLTGHPALIDEGDAVGVKVLGSAVEARREHHAGLRRLFMLKLAKDIRYLRKQIPGLQQMRLQYANAAERHNQQSQERHDLEQELIALVIDKTFINNEPEINDQQAFQQRLEGRKGELITIAQETFGLAAEILSAYQKVRKSLSSINQINWLVSVQDMQEQLDDLVYKGFLKSEAEQQLKQYPRYLKAMSLRIEKLRQAPERDQQRLREMKAIQEQWRLRDQARRKYHRADERLDEIRWMLEELRISLFAQEVKTAYPVSVKRIQKRWRELGL